MLEGLVTFYGLKLELGFFRVGGVRKLEIGRLLPPKRRKLVGTPPSQHAILGKIFEILAPIFVIYVLIREKTLKSFDPSHPKFGPAET